MKMKLFSIFRREAGAGAFFLSILVWGIGVGCFAAAMNNFLSELYGMNGMDRGWLEFFRELPGLLLVFILALLHRVSDWKVMRIGSLISLAGAALLLVPTDKIFVTGTIMIWSMGEHLVMPVRSAIAMQIARPAHAGQSLGYLTGVINFGTVAGSLLVAAVFFLGVTFFDIPKAILFRIVWCIVAGLMLISVVCSFSPSVPRIPSRRPRLLFDRKFGKFYALELFYGARKQIFITFAPYVLIREYGFSTSQMATLLGVCALVNIIGGPAVGRVTDRLGYRTVMIWDTIILFFVCLLYGYAGKIFPAAFVTTVLCLNFLLDTVLSTTSLATNIYVRTLASSNDELTATLSTGISINHLIAILSAPIGGWIWMKFGIGVLFGFAAVMAVCNSLFAMTIPKPAAVQRHSAS